MGRIRRIGVVEDLVLVCMRVEQCLTTLAEDVRYLLQYGLLEVMSARLVYASYAGAYGKIRSKDGIYD